MAINGKGQLDDNGTGAVEDLVFIPSSLPLISAINTDSLMMHFDDLVYDKSSTSHLRHLIEAMCGESGLGQLLNMSVRDWLNNGVETSWLGFVDQLFSSVYGLPRLYTERTKYNASDAVLTADEVNEALVKEAWYKARFTELMNAFTAGGTVKGFRYAVMAICYCDCDIYETWRYKKEDFPVGRLGYTLYNEAVVCPYSKTITEQQKDLLLRVLERIKPADVIVTIDMNGLEAYTDKPIRSVSASSTYFEISKILTNSIDNAQLPDKVQMFDDKYAYGYDAYLNLEKGDKTEVRKAIQNRTQEYSEYYAYDKSTVSQIANVSYQVIDAMGNLKNEKDFIEKSSSIKWSAWRPFAIADSPDNYPGGKYGRTPRKAPALNKDGTDYIFDYQSQEEYVAQKSDQILNAGGQVKDDVYRTKLSTSVTSTVYTPDMSLVSINDAYNTVQNLPEIEETKVNSFNKVTLRNMQ